MNSLLSEHNVSATGQIAESILTLLVGRCLKTPPIHLALHKLNNEIYFSILIAFLGKAIGNDLPSSLCHTELLQGMKPSRNL